MRTLHLYSNYHISKQVHNIRKGDWILLENGMSRKRWAFMFRYKKIDETGLNITYITSEEFFNLDKSKYTFNIVGNPPYQDGNKEGGQNKIYNQFCKKALELGNVVAMVTPTSVCKKSKRFSLLGLEGLKRVDFTANDHFNVGVKICSWIVDRSYNGDVEVVSNTGIRTQSNDTPIHNIDGLDTSFTKLYDYCRKLAIKDRMFSRNAVDATNGRRMEPTDGFEYPVYKLQSDGNSTLQQYNKPKPHFHNKEKFVMCITKAHKSQSSIIDERNYDVAHVSTEVTSSNEVENIKSFIFSEYFINHVEQFKKIDGYGYNMAMVYCPIFDKTRSWTNDEVKDFFESLLPKNTQKIYDRVMDLCQDTKKADNRMFKRNNHGPAFSPTESEQHCYPIYCNNRGNEYFVYTRRQPVFHKEQKLIISNTKALKEENIIVDDRDYGPSYFAYPVTTDAEIENIKSFVLSEYFVALAQEFRRIRGGQNTVLIDYCPIFDKTRPWTNDEVKDFFENL